MAEVTISRCELTGSAARAAAISLAAGVGVRAKRASSAAAAAPILIGGGSRDVRVGPYNAVGDGVVSGTSLKDWAAAAPDACCRLDARTEAAAARAVTPGDFYWRFLPVSQLLSERLALPHAFAMPDTPRMPPAAEAALAGVRGQKAQRAEMLVQSKFVVSAATRARTLARAH
jgi:hypothetical protein